MNIYGYAKEKDLNEHGLMNMSEITIVGSAERLKKIAKFINEYADQLEGGNIYEHEHFSDYDEEHDDSSVDIIIVKET